ncbi:MAG: hypothetical protein ACYTHM_22700, partial [Planctomycetota bacterium]
MEPDVQRTPDFREENLLILRQGIISGILREDDVAESARLAGELQGQPIGPILVQKGLCTRKAFLKLISQLETKILFCPACQAFTKTGNLLVKPPCPACGDRLVLYEFTDLPKKTIPSDSPATTALHIEKNYELGEEI